MNGKILIGAAVAAVAAATALPLQAIAHHSFAMFDQTKEIELKDATVKEWQWTSPHCWLFVLVPNGTSEPEKYSLEGGNPGVLRREGFGKNSFMPGDKVTIYLAPLKDGQKGGAIRAVLLSNGTILGKRLTAKEPE